MSTRIWADIFFRNKKEIVRMPVPSLTDTLAVFKEGFWSLMLPVIIFGGIFSGAFTANEAAVVACIYAFMVELFIHRSIRFGEVKKITVSSAVTSATLLIIVAGASCFGRLLTLENIPGAITEAVLSAIQSPLLFLVAMNFLLLVVGMFMDIISATMILIEGLGAEDDEAIVEEAAGPAGGEAELEEVFRELVSFPEMMNLDSFSLEVLLVQEEEVRRYDGKRG